MGVVRWVVHYLEKLVILQVNEGAYPGTANVIYSLVNVFQEILVADFFSFADYE